MGSMAVEQAAGAGSDLRSMTGFADGRWEQGEWSWTADIRSVNGRGLDLRLRVPDWISGLEPELRKRLQGRLARGSVSVNIRVSRSDSTGGARIDEAGLAAALEKIRHIEAAAHSTGVSLGGTRASDVAAMRGVLDVSDAGGEDVEGLRAAMLDSFEVLLGAFETDRAREGAALHSVISAQLDQIEELTAKARGVADARFDGVKAAMQRALARLLDVAEVPDEARLTQELAMIAVKNDVTEEMDRLHSHIAAARSLMGDGGAVGRKFDFLMQEFNREANTLCSKAQSTDLTAVGLDLKAVIDQMREQVQNVE